MRSFIKSGGKRLRNIRTVTIPALKGIHVNPIIQANHALSTVITRSLIEHFHCGDRSSSSKSIIQILHRNAVIGANVIVINLCFFSLANESIQATNVFINLINFGVLHRIPRDSGIGGIDIQIALHRSHRASHAFLFAFFIASSHDIGKIKRRFILDSVVLILAVVLHLHVCRRGQYVIEHNLFQTPIPYAVALQIHRWVVWMR